MVKKLIVNTLLSSMLFVAVAPQAFAGNTIDDEIFNSNVPHQELTQHEVKTTVGKGWRYRDRRSWVKDYGTYTIERRKKQYRYKSRWFKTGWHTYYSYYRLKFKNTNVNTNNEYIPPEYRTRATLKGPMVDIPVFAMDAIRNLKYIGDRLGAKRWSRRRSYRWGR